MATFDATGRPASVAHDARGGLTLWLKPLSLLAAAACMALVLNAAPAHAQENNPEERDITYEDLDPPGGGTENNPEDSDIIYEDFPNDLPADEGATTPCRSANNRRARFPNLRRSSCCWWGLRVPSSWAVGVRGRADHPHADADGLPTRLSEMKKAGLARLFS